MQAIVPVVSLRSTTGYRLESFQDYPSALFFRSLTINCHPSPNDRLSFPQVSSGNLMLQCRIETTDDTDKHGFLQFSSVFLSFC